MRYDFDVFVGWASCLILPVPCIYEAGKMPAPQESSLNSAMPINFTSPLTPNPSPNGRGGKHRGKNTGGKTQGWLWFWGEVLIVFHKREIRYIS